MNPRYGWLCAAIVLCNAGALSAQTAVETLSTDSTEVRLRDVDLRSALLSLAGHLPKPMILGNLPVIRITVESPGRIPRRAVAGLVRSMLAANQLELVEDSSAFRVTTRAPSPPATALVSGASATGVIRASGGLPADLLVLPLRHARAEDVAATVSQLFGASSPFASNVGAPPGAAERGRVETPGVQSPVTRSGVPGSRGAMVVPDPQSNSLLIRADPGDLAAMQDVIGKLDVRPLQVLIEVLIVEARSDAGFSLGAALAAETSTSGGTTASADLLSSGLGSLVLRLMTTGRTSIDAVLGLEQRRGNVRIVSRPVLLASNNVEASFLVGSQRPFVAVSRSLPTDAPQRDQVVQYRDVGTKLTVKPTINGDGYVTLQLHQEVSAVTSELAFDAPVISTRDARTQLLVRDSQTIVIGGLRDRQRDRIRVGIPLLSQIPVLGGLFGRTQTSESTTELFLFLTPYVITNDEDSDRVTESRMPETMP